MIGGAGRPSNPLSGFGFANLTREISNAPQTVRAIASSINAVPVAPVSNREVS